MGLNASKAKGGAPRTPPLEAGPYPARLVQVIDLGLQPRQYKGEDKEPHQQIMLTYELVDEFLLDEQGQPQEDKPRWVSETFPLYALGADKAKSNERLKALDPQGKAEGDFTKLLGEPVVVNIVQNPSKQDPSKIYAKVSGLAPMRAKDVIKLGPLVNKPVFLDLDNPNKAVFDSLPDWVKDKIRAGLEYRGSEAEKCFGVGSKAEAKKEAKPKDEEADGNPY